MGLNSYYSLLKKMKNYATADFNTLKAATHQILLKSLRRQPTRIPNPGPTHTFFLRKNFNATRPLTGL